MINRAYGNISLRAGEIGEMDKLRFCFLKREKTRRNEINLFFIWFWFWNCCFLVLRCSVGLEKFKFIILTKKREREIVIREFMNEINSVLNILFLFSQVTIDGGSQLVCDFG